MKAHKHEGLLSLILWLVDDEWGEINAIKHFIQAAYFDNFLGERKSSDQLFAITDDELRMIVCSNLLQDGQQHRAQHGVLMHISSYQAGTPPWALTFYLRLLTIGNLIKNPPLTMPRFSIDEETDEDVMWMVPYESFFYLIQGMCIAMHHSSFWLVNALKKPASKRRKADREALRHWIAFEHAAAIILEWVFCAFCPGRADMFIDLKEADARARRLSAKDHRVASTAFRTPGIARDRSILLWILVASSSFRC